MLVDGKNIDISIQTSLESPQFKLAWNEGKWYKLYAGACILCIPAFTTITTNISQDWAEAAGVSWCTCLVWQHRGMDSESSRSYFGKIATEQSLPRPTIWLLHSYTGVFFRCSTYKTVCTFRCKEMQVPFQMLSKSWAMKLAATIRAWGLTF